MRAEILEAAKEKGVILASDAYALLKDREDYREIIEKLAELKPIINREDIEKLIIKKETKVAIDFSVEVKGKLKEKTSKEYEANFRIIKSLNEEKGIKGSAEEFAEMFRSKYETIKELFKKRGLTTKPISSIKRSFQKEVVVIGMVFEIWKSKNGNLCITLEDLEDKCTIIFPKSNERLFARSEKILLDDVIAVKGNKISNNAIIANEFYYADFPNEKVKLIDKPISICVIADIHIGSKLFLENRLKKFLEWLKSNEAEKIKYLFIVGDNVDGVGVYPGQEKELNILDIYAQYEELEKYLLEIPEHIEVFICPGQHDAVRLADPQPAIPKKFLPELSKLKNFHLVSSPSWIEVEGLKVLIYHGASLNSLYSKISSLSAKEPEKGIIEALKRRSLAFEYGIKQPYLPEEFELMLIKDKPDFYFGGDTHHIGYACYKGITIVNTSTFQAQTDFQLKQGHVPTPGIIPIIELDKRKLIEKRV